MNLSSTKAHCLTVLILIFILLIYGCNHEVAYPEGGYTYPAHVEDKDTTFYCYPLKDIIAPFDTIKTTETYNLLRLFDEYNLSIKPAKTTIFRFTYLDWHFSTIITLTPTEIIVKKQTKFWKYPLHDKTKLNKTEREDFQNFEFLITYSDHTFYEMEYRDVFDSLEAVNPELLNSKYYKDLLNKTIYGDKSFYAKQYKHDFDSLIKLKPRLLNAGYYKELLDKSADPGSDKFDYSIAKIPISKKTFTYLANLINESGYWQLPFENKCEFVPTDASNFILEANTPRKYKFVTSINCHDDTTKYVRACQELIKSAKLEEEIRLIWSGAATTDEPVKGRELELTEIKDETPPPKQKKKKVQ